MRILLLKERVIPVKNKVVIEKVPVSSYSPSAALEKILPSYKRYYDIKTENVTEGFAAEAEFHSHNEQYFLVKSAKLADMDSHDYVFFAEREVMTFEEAQKLAFMAWQTAQSRIKPVYGHKNSDVTLIILSDSFAREEGKKCGKIHYSVSYKMGMYGWSNFKLMAVSLKDERFYSNWHGRDLKKQIKNMLQRKVVNKAQ